MQLCTPPKEKRLALTLLRGDEIVFSDPLSHALFGGAPPVLPKEEHRGRLVTASTPYLLFRRDLSLEDTAYTLYLALPVSAREAEDPAALAALSSITVEDLLCRFTTLFAKVGKEPSLSSFSLLSFFHTLTEGICANLYAPLSVEVLGKIDTAFISADRAHLSVAIGLALSAMLREGQSGLSMRLSGDDSFYTLSLSGERGVSSPFLFHLLEVLARRGGFAIRHADACVRFLLFPSHAPAALLRCDHTDILAALYEGFFFLP